MEQDVKEIEQNVQNEEQQRDHVDEHQQYQPLQSHTQFNPSTHLQTHQTSNEEMKSEENEQKVENEGLNQDQSNAELQQIQQLQQFSTHQDVKMHIDQDHSLPNQQEVVNEQNSNILGHHGGQLSSSFNQYSHNVNENRGSPKEAQRIQQTNSLNQVECNQNMSNEQGIKQEQSQMKDESEGLQNSNNLDNQQEQSLHHQSMSLDENHHHQVKEENKHSDSQYFQSNIDNDDGTSQTHSITQAQLLQQSHHQQQQQVVEDDDDGVIVTTSMKQQSANQQTPQQNKYQQANSNGPNYSKVNGATSTNGVNGSASSSEKPGGSGISGYHMQQNLQVSSQLTKAVFDAIKKGDIELVKAEQQRIGLNIAFLQEDSFKQNAIFIGAQIKDEQSSLKMVQWLISQGVSATQTDSLNQTALFYASRDGKISLLRFLLEQGCQANHVDSNGQTPMFYSSREGHVEACRILFEHGANPDLEDHNGQTPLYYAARGGKIETVEFLIKSGADVNHEDKKKQTPMHIAKRSNKQQIMNMLTEHGAKGLEELRKLNKQKDKKLQETKNLFTTQLSSSSLLTGSQIPIDTQKSSSNLAQQNPVPAQFPPQPKQKVQNPPQERKQAKRYVLTVLKDGQWEPLTIEELDKFEELHPDLAKFWKDPSTLESIQLPRFPENAPIYESWDKAAKRLLNTLWKCSQAWIFHDPVDPEKLGIPDYFEIIKTPMDFGTIKQRLNNNYYHRLQEFLNDIQLVFDNCVKFNGDDSQVGRMCKSVRDEFKKLYEQLNLDFYLQ